MSIKKAIARNLKKIIKDKKISNHSIARDAKISIVHLRMICKAEANPSIMMLNKIASAIGVSVEDIVRI